MLRRTWLATLLLPSLVAGAALTPTSASAVTVGAAGGPTGTHQAPVSRAAAAPTAGPAARFSTRTTRQWTYASLGSTATTTQSVRASIHGTGRTNRNGGLVLRRAGARQFVVANFTGTRYQLFIVQNGRMSLAYDAAVRTPASGVARAEVSGSTVKAYWNDVLVATTTRPVLAGFTGRGAGLAIWQDVPSAVTLVAAARSSVTTEVARTGRTWLSGVAGADAGSGGFASWRGSAVGIGGTWNDSVEAQVAQWTLQPGGEYGSWQGDLDVAMGAIDQSRGETWAAAARGAYDERWRTALSNMRRGWGAKPGTLHIRFAHEFNGEWVPWSVRGRDTANFIAAWKRVRALQLELLPRHRLVFSPNDASSRSLGLDWRRAFPGAAYVDEMAVDSYNQYEWVNTAAGFARKIDRVDEFGAPAGIERHRLFAASVGRPLAIPEWSSNASMGDAPVYMAQFHEWVRSHAGTGSGQVPYEILFNIGGFGTGQFQLFPQTQQSAAAAAYTRLW